MIEASIFIGIPKKFLNITYIYPPTVKDILSEPMYNTGYSILTQTQDDIRDEFKKKGGNPNDAPTPFRYIIALSQIDKKSQEIIQQSFELFCKEPVTILPAENKIIFGDLAEEVKRIDSVSKLRILTEENFFLFQNQLRLAMGNKEEKPYQPPNPNEDPRVTRIKERARERDRLIAKKGRKGGISFGTSLVAICCMKIGLTPLNIGELSYAAVGPLMSMMQKQEKYHIDIKSLLAGADSKKIKPKYWIEEKENK